MGITINRVMMKMIFAIFSITLIFASAESKALDEGTCLFAHKDYDSPGFQLPVHSGFHTTGRFGCVYVCECQAQEYKITHVLTESHFEIGSSSGETGGPSRAKWFICPRSVREDSWTPRYDIYGTLMYYDVEVEDRPFSAANSKIKEIQNFCK